MKKYKAAVLSVNPSQIDYVYTADQLREIESVTDFLPGVYGVKDVEDGKLKEAEVIFSTWGMACLTDSQLDRMPSLKAVFYAAGATDYFARPLFARGIDSRGGVLRRADHTRPQGIFPCVPHVEIPGIL